MSATINSIRAAFDFPPLRREDGSLDPDGDLTVAELDEKRRITMRVTGDRARDAQTLDDELHGYPAPAVPNGKGVQPVISPTPGEGWTLRVKPIADGREYETSAELDKAIAEAKARVDSGKAAPEDAKLVALAEPEKPAEGDVKPLEVPRADH